MDQEHYFLLIVDDYSRYTTVFPLRSKTAVSENSPTLRWTGEVGDASTFRIWGALSLVRDTNASKLSPRTLRCVFLGFPTNAPPWQFYHPASRRVLSSQDFTFDESVCFYQLYPHALHPLPPPPLFLEPVPPPVDPLPPQGPAPSSVSQVDPPPLVEPLEISPDSAGLAEGGDPAADDTATTRRSPRLETPPGFPPQSSSPPLQPAAVESGAAKGGDTGAGASGGAGPWGADPGAEPGGAETGGAETGGADSGGVASPSGGGVVGAPVGGPRVGQPQMPSRLETLSPQQIREWIVQQGRPGSGGYGVTASGAAGAGGAASAGGARATSPGGAAGAGGAGAASPGGTAGAGGAGGAAGAGGAGAASPGGTSGAGGAGGAVGAGGAPGGAGGTKAAGTGGAGATGAGVGATRGAGGTGGTGGADGTCTAPRRPFFYPQPLSSLPLPDSALRQVLSHPSSTGLTPPLLCPPTDQSQPQLLPGSPLPAPAPHTGVIESLAERREPETRASTPVRGRRVARSCPPAVPDTHVLALHFARAAIPTVIRLLATVVTDPDFESIVVFALVTELEDFAAMSRLDYIASLVTDSESVRPPSVGGEPALSSDVLEDRQFKLECLATALPRFTSMLFCPEGDPDALDIPTPRSYAEAIAGEYSSQWQIAMDKEMASWKSTGTCVNKVPPPGANIVDAQRDYELHSLEFSRAFLQGSLHEEIWLRYPPGFTGSFPAGTQWSLRRPVYGLRQAPREWHDKLRMTLAVLGFAPSSADPSMFLRTDTTLPLFYVLVYVEDLVFATGDTEALALGKAELQERHTCTDLEPIGPYPELVGCLVYLTTCTRPDLAYPLSLLARFVAPGRHRKVNWDAAKRVLHYLCSTSGMGLVLGGRGLVVITGHSDASWADDQATHRSSQGYSFSLGSGFVSWRSTRSSSVLGSSCESEIYAWAMAAQELRWLTYLLTDLGERPRSPPILYVDNKAMLALCQEQILKHRTKHIALRYFLARELQQCGQLRLSYVASWANTADVFTKALGSGDHQRLCTALGLVPTLPPQLVA
ncbi:unnamed protein product [Closterium sp. NIES-54]